jgi:bifunctional DNA-binding transcriptional regulator/antitoxin component of YhaV-PrlF toxin-antitoxin module
VVARCRRSRRSSRCFVRLGCLQCTAMTSAVSTARVSNRGQTSLPAALRHRWGIDEGGEVAFVDLGHAALVVPGGIGVARDELRRVLLDGGYERGVALLDDPDLADQ